MASTVVVKESGVANGVALFCEPVGHQVEMSVAMR